MKKFLMILFSFLFISSAFVGGSLLLSGCNSSNVSENLPNDPTDVPSSDPSDEENDNTSENPGGNSENEDDNVGEGDNDDSDDVNANSVNFSVQVRAYVPFSPDPVSYSSLDFYVGKFDIHWCEGDGKSGHGDAKTWGNTPSKSAAYGYSVVGGGSGDTYARNLDYFSYSYGMNVQRYAWINCSAATNFVRWSVNTSSSFESSRQSTGTTSGNVFLYGKGTTSTSKPTSSVGTTMSGNWYVKFRAQLSMSFNYNGGSGSTSSKTFYAGKSVSMPSAPTRAGYKFTGWQITNNGRIMMTNASAGSSVSWSDLVWPSMNGYSNTYTATAQWEANEYTNTYYYRNASGTQTSTTQTHTGSFTTLTASSINEYVSNGWSLYLWGTSTSTTSAGFNPGEQVSSLTAYNLYAISDRIVTLSYSTGSGSSLSSTSGRQRWNQYSGTVTTVSLTVTSTRPTRTGYAFLGWSTSSSATTVNYDPGDTYTFSRGYNQSASVTLYAVWERDTYTNYYRYRNTSGSTTSTSQSRTYGQSFTTLTTSNISEYVSNGWSLYGWATSSTSTSRTYSPGQSVSSTSTSTIYYYAISSRTVSITYNTNSGSFSTTPTTSGTQRWNQYGNAITTVSLTVTSTRPTRTGYTFLGWSTSSSASTVNYDPGDTYTFSRAYNSSASVTLYAVWERATYTNYYRYRNTSGTTTSTTQTRTYGQSFTTLTTSSISEYVSNGWSLYGWATSSTTTSRTYATNATVSSTAYINSTSTLNFYAISSRTARISYSANGGSFSSTPSTTGTQRWNQYGNAITTVSLTVTSTRPTKTGYTFMGWSTSSSASGATYDPGDTYSFSRAYNSSATVTLYAVWQAKNPAYYDEAGDYWYIENGKMPQSKVTGSLKTTLNSQWGSLANGSTYVMGVQSFTSKVYNGNEYCLYNNEYYLVEPIRWRLQANSSQQAGYGTTTDTLAIMDTIVYIGRYSTEEINAGSGYQSTAVDYLYNTLNNENNGMNSTYLVSWTQSTPTFGTTSLNGTAQNVTARVFVSSVDEINTVAGSGKVKFSDLVKDYLKSTGNGMLYYTRDLGTNYNNVWCMNENGDRTQRKPNLTANRLGVQFTIKVTEYACV